MLETIKNIFNFKKKEFRGQKYDHAINFSGGYTEVVDYDLVDAYSIHPWVYAAVYAIATNFASVDYLPYILKANGEEVDDNKHPLKSLFLNPNPFISGYQLKEILAISLEMTGNAYIGVERGASGQIIELWPLPPHRVKAVSSKSKPIDHYIYEIDGKSIPYDYQDIFHFKFSNPNSYIYGQSSVAAAGINLTTDLFASAWNKNFFKNSARPDAVIETDQSLNSDDRSRIMSAWNRLLKGVDKNYGNLILESGLKYKEVNRTHKDMEFLEQKKADREAILASFGVPPVMVGVFEYANYANADAQIKIFWQNTMLPRIRSFESTLTLRARQAFYRPMTYFKADLTNVEGLKVNEKMRADTASVYVNIGVPLNAVIDALKLPFDHTEDGDKPRQPVQFQSTTEQPKSINIKSNKEISDKEKRDITREAIWKSFDRKLLTHEHKFIVSMNSFFKAQRRRVLNRLEKFGTNIIGGRLEKGILKGLYEDTLVSVQVIFPDDEDKILKPVLERQVRLTFFDFANAAGKEIVPDFDFNMQDKNALDWIENKSTKISRQLNNTTKEALTENIVSAIEDGIAQGFKERETIQEIADRIDGIYQLAVESRSTTIARTEVISASNYGQLQGYLETGVEAKEWLSAKDDKVRDTHVALDGEVVPIRAHFISPSGARLEFPGDPDAPAGEIINCRCSFTPINNRHD